MNPIKDGPVSPLFQPFYFIPGMTREEIAASGKISPEMQSALTDSPSGECVCWGIPFQVNGLFLLTDQAVTLNMDGIQARWLVFMHTSDLRPLPRDNSGLIIPPMRGEGQLNEHAADYVISYEDGSEIRLPIRRRHQVGAFTRRWGDNCFQAVEASKPAPMLANHEQPAEILGSVPDAQPGLGVWTLGELALVMGKS